MKTRYLVEISGGSSSFGRNVLYVNTIAEGRAVAEEYGNTADEAKIMDRRWIVVASHRRDTSGDGMRWFKAAV